MHSDVFIAKLMPTSLVTKLLAPSLGKVAALFSGGVPERRAKDDGVQPGQRGHVVSQRARVRRLQRVVVVHKRDPGRRGKQHARVAHGARLFVPTPDLAGCATMRSLVGRKDVAVVVVLHEPVTVVQGGSRWSS